MQLHLQVLQQNVKQQLQRDQSDSKHFCISINLGIDKTYKETVKQMFSFKLVPDGMRSQIKETRMRMNSKLC